MDDDRARLKALAAALVGLHALLMERERRAYESIYGPVTSGELLRLLLGDEHFAWLRSLSSLMAAVDELLDTEASVMVSDSERMFRRAHQLLKSGDSGVFQDKYREALQQSPEVVMAHARVSALLRL
jgi:hypothetical protein